jgi:hypothetical protein
MPRDDTTRLLALRPSRALLVGILLAHGCAAVVWLAVPTAAGWTLGVLATIAASLVLALRGAGRSGSGGARPAGLRCEAGGTWVLIDAHGSAVPVRLLADTFMHDRLVILRLAIAGGRRISLVLPWDAMEEQDFRRLKVRLTLERRRGGDGRLAPEEVSP